MSFEWPLVRLGDIAEITSSKRIKRADYVSSGIPFFRSKEIIELSKGNAISTELFISEEQFFEIRKRFGVPEVGDILLTSVGTLGVPYQVKDSKRFYFKDGNLTWIKGFKSSVVPDFVLYWIQSPVAQRKLDEVSIGSTQRALTIVALKSVEVPLPPIFVQIKIVDILKSLDQKLDINRNINQTLEAMAQAIFKSWFVDFDPVRAKIAALEEGEDPLRAAMCAISGKTDAELEGMSREDFEQLAATAALFPDAMEDSELGEIPRGWGCVALSEMIQLIGGGTPKRSESDYWDGDILWFSVRDAPNDGDVWVVDTEEKITDLGLQKSSTKLLPVGATIISARGTVGKLALVGREMAMNQSCYGVLGAEGVGSCFNYLNLKEAVEKLQRNTHGAVFDTITRATFETVDCVRPSVELLQVFEQKVQSLIEKIRSNVLQSRVLSEARDVLLPELLSGRLI